jgi:hypothetical protein
MYANMLVSFYVKIHFILKAQTSSDALPILIKVLFASDNLFWVDDELFLVVKNHFLSPKKLSDVNKSFIDIGNGQKI